MLTYKKILILSLALSITYHTATMNNNIENQIENQTKKQKQFKKLPGNLQIVIHKLKSDPVNNEIHLLALTGKIEELNDLYENKQIFFKEKINQKETQALITPLFCATVGGNLDCVKFLLEHGASIKTKTADNNSLIHFAASCGHTHIAQFFLDQKMNINITNDKSATPLHIAAKYNHPEMISWLIEHNANINTTNNVGYNAIHLAAFNGSLEAAKIIASLKPELLNATTPQILVTPLHCAVLSNNPKFIRWLIKQNVNIEATNNVGYNAIHFAAFNGSLEEAKIIASLKPELLNATTPHILETPLHCAVVSNKPEFITWLIKKNVDIGAKRIDGSNAMHIAAEFNSIESAQILYSAEPNLINSTAISFINQQEGHTPLHSAILRNKSKCIIWLLEMGANLTTRIHQDNVLHLAAHYNHSQVITTILNWIKNIKPICNTDLFINKRLNFLPEDFKYNNQCLVPLKQEIKNLTKLLLLCRKDARNNQKNQKSLEWIVGNLPKPVLFLIAEFTFKPEEIIEYLLSMKNNNNQKPFELATDNECINMLMPKNNNNDNDQLNK